MRFALLSILFVTLSFGFGINVVNKNAVNGSTVLIEFDKSQSFSYQNVEFSKKKYKIFDNPLDDKKAYVLIPVSYYEKAAQKELKINYKVSDSQANTFFMLDIKNGDYKKEQITVSSSKVNPKNKDVIKRTQKEYAEAMKIYGSITDKNYLSSKFIMPLESKITSEFGKARIYNGSLNGYHSGTDFRAKTPTPIKCVNDGVVVLAQDRFYAGNSVIVDHGRGIYTCYYHLSKFDVKKGDEVKKGQILGLSGSTGRVTGPHLHFAVRVGTTVVDPMHFISLMNENILKGSK
jgi:murein DD-endopeptidase MepM/ murein hydrolase activator NlpD